MRYYWYIIGLSLFFMPPCDLSQYNLTGILSSAYQNSFADISLKPVLDLIREGRSTHMPEMFRNDESHQTLTLLMSNYECCTLPVDFKRRERLKGEVCQNLLESCSFIKIRVPYPFRDTVICLRDLSEFISQLIHTILCGHKYLDTQGLSSYTHPMKKKDLITSYHLTSWSGEGVKKIFDRRFFIIYVMRPKHVRQN